MRVGMERLKRVNRKMRLAVSNEDISSNSAFYEFRREQVAGLESPLTFSVESKGKKGLAHFAFAAEQTEGRWRKLLFETLSVTEKQTKKFFPSVALPKKFRERGLERVTFKEICYAENAIKLKVPIKTNVEKELLNTGEKWSLYYEPLDIFVSAPTLDECKEDFQEEFFVLCEEYAEEGDENLTESARELKRRLLNLVAVEKRNNEN